MIVLEIIWKAHLEGRITIIFLSLFGSIFTYMHENPEIGTLTPPVKDHLLQSNISPFLLLFALKDSQSGTKTLLFKS